MKIHSRNKYYENQEGSKMRSVVTLKRDSRKKKKKNSKDWTTNLINWKEEEYLEERASSKRPSVENPEHLSSLSVWSMWPLSFIRRAMSASVTIIRRKWRALRQLKASAISRTQGAAYPPQSSRMRLNMAARGLPLSLSDSRRGKRRRSRSGLVE